MAASLSHIDTCLPCYLQDHHNRDGELLLGVPVDNSTTYGELKEAIRAEFAMVGDSCPEDEVSTEDFEAAIADCFASVKDGKVFDSSLDPAGEDDPEQCHAWFLLTWETAHAS